MSYVKAIVELKYKCIVRVKALDEVINIFRNDIK